MTILANYLREKLRIKDSYDFSNENKGVSNLKYK